MCFCDGKYFLITNRTKEEKHLVNGNDGLTHFFGDSYPLPFLLHRYIKNEQIRFEDNCYTISINTHPECEKVRRNIIREHGFPQSGFLLERCPEKYRHLLPEERQMADTGNGLCRKNEQYLLTKG